MDDQELDDTQSHSGHDEHPIVAGLGARVRKLRQEQCLTLEELARRSTVSRAMLSKIERSEKVPTLGTVVRVAKGLNVTLSGLLGAEPDSSEVAIHRARDRIVFRDPKSGFERETLSSGHTPSDVEIVLHRLPPGRSTGVLPAYAVPTDKYVLVQAGILSAEVEGATYTVEEGDTLFFSVKSPYRFSNEGKKHLVYLLVMIRGERA
jgi:transcriptional regulator with XRE-family HTH domain